MNLKYLFVTVTIVILSVMHLNRSTAQTVIAADGKSTFTIIIPEDPPNSVVNAAQELQKDIELAANINLPIVDDTAENFTNFISLGDTKQAKTAGFNSEKMPDESFRIATKDDNLYIFGPDTPDGGWTKNNGTSNGTAHGVYTFLEDYLNVRWLMPGDIGRDVPAKSTFVLEEIDRTETPQFSWRRVTHIYDYATQQQFEKAQEWERHQKLGGATNWYYMHNWWRQLNQSESGKRTTDVNTDAIKKIYKEHPDWFAMNEKGEHPYPTSLKSKLETTNPELVRWFANQASEHFKNSERPSAFSLSPSDGSEEYHWSKSPESKALLDPIPEWDPIADRTYQNSTASLVMKWYYDIAQIVAKEHPDRRLTGFLYAAYLYPPLKVEAKLPPNFTPYMAPRSNYGYRLYREDVQKYFRTLMDSWADIVTGEWFYYDLPNQFTRQPSSVGANFPGSTGIITPPAPGIVNTVFHQLDRSHINGANIYGVSSWSNAALANYLLAKMEWNPKLDAHDIQREWLHRAYGPAAGVVMEKFYEDLDDRYREYYKNSKTGYMLSLDVIKSIYKPHYPEMEKLFLQAKAQKMTDIQKQRLQMIEDNLIVLQWRMRQIGIFSDNFDSQLQRSDAQVSELIAQSDGPDIAMFPGVANSNLKRRELGKGMAFPWEVQFNESLMPTGKRSPAPKWYEGELLIYAAQDGEIRITTQTVSHSAYFAAYELYDQKGKVLKAGIFNIEEPLVITAKKGEYYTLRIPIRKPVDFSLQVENAVVAEGSLSGKTLMLSGKSAPVYVYYQQGNEPLGIIQDRDGVRILKPYGNKVGESYAKKRFEKVSFHKTFNSEWLFSPDSEDDGLQRGVIRSDFDDSSWSPISPYDFWQMQGFDYHGAAWYRLKFEWPENLEFKKARFYFGAIDGNTEIYLNGEKIREHLLGVNYEGWNKYFSADAKPALKAGENLLAVKVSSKNEKTASGIFKGVALIGGE